MSDAETIEQDVLVCVDPAKLDAIWPHAKHFIHAAYWTGLGDDTPESIKRDLDSGDALLWLVWDGKGLLAAAVTSVVEAPARKLCIVRCAAGRNVERWVRFIADLEAYAKRERCEVMRIHGRQGWKHFLPDYREPWVALEKELR